MVNLPTSSTFHFVNSHFVNSHFVNSHFFNFDQMGIDKVGIDEVGINRGDQLSILLSFTAVNSQSGYIKTHSAACAADSNFTATISIVPVVSTPH